MNPRKISELCVVSILNRLLRQSSPSEETFARAGRDLETCLSMIANIDVSRVNSSRDGGLASREGGATCSEPGPFGLLPNDGFDLVSND